MTTARSLPASEGERMASGHFREVMDTQGLWGNLVFDPVSWVNTAGPPSLVPGTTVAGGGSYALPTASLSLPGLDRYLVHSSGCL